VMLVQTLATSSTSFVYGFRETGFKILNVCLSTQLADQSVLFAPALR